MSGSIRTFTQDLGISSGVGLTRGVGRPGAHLTGFAEAEMHYRTQRLLTEADGRRDRKTGRTRRPGGPGPAGPGEQASNRVSTGSRATSAAGKLMTRWTTWFPSVPGRRSSAGSPNSNACGS